MAVTLQLQGAPAVEQAQILTISGGEITQTTFFHKIAAETGTTDNLDTINLPENRGSFLPFIILAADTGDTITLRHNVGNLFFSGEIDLVLTGNQYAYLFYSGSKYIDFKGTGSAGGEVNTASNVGTDGVGVFDGKVGVDLQFRNIAPDTSGNVTVALDAVDNDIDLDIITARDTRNGLKIERISDSVLTVGTGSLIANGKIYDTSTASVIDLVTGASWIGGASLEAANSWVSIYKNLTTGAYYLYDSLPNSPAAETFIATMQVNQPGWVGTAGNGLNAISVIYDNDSGEGGVQAGMYALFYDDSAYRLGRGKGSGAAATKNAKSIAKIIAINTGTNTLTLEAGHQIAINNDDYIVIVKNGSTNYLQVSSVWYYWLGALYNDGSSNLVAANNQSGRSIPRANESGYNFREATDYSTSSTSFVAIDTTRAAGTIITDGGSVFLSFNAPFVNTAPDVTYLDIRVDGRLQSGATDGITWEEAAAASIISSADLHYIISGLLPGTHTLEIFWKVLAGTTTMFVNNTVFCTLSPQFYIKELS